MEFISNIYPPAPIPLPKRNFHHNSKESPSEMHAHKFSLVKSRYQSRALTASPLSPPIPPKPDFTQYKQSFPLFDTPPPPPRCYQLIPIGDSITNQVKSEQSSIEERSFNRNNYENIRKTTNVTSRDPRRIPYYYNELNRNLDVDFDEQDSNAKFESVANISNDEIQQSLVIKEELAPNYGSGGSLNYIF